MCRKHHKGDKAFLLQLAETAGVTEGRKGQSLILIGFEQIYEKRSTLGQRQMLVTLG